ncbi:DUF4928 family protein [uncultured Aquitalea sp.]|uniref:DUF4928 family protein n=1 Tax=uncultured Aquitalea sp. TaxID=540272 RepID=UPI0025E48082|nr:DUF4928 family protein [uncultured Aquitalea sp.]
MTLEQSLRHYQKDKRLKSKGQLATMLYVSRKARTLGLPLDPSLLLTSKQGQINGLSKRAVQAILAEYGETRVLAEECGRTSRGSLGNMQDYVAFLNDIHAKGLADLSKIEAWWVERIRDFFAAKPFKLKYDTSKSFRGIIRDLLQQAEKRQKDNPGTMYAGAVLQHLVGAKLTLALPETSIAMNGFSVADAVSDRSGDFVIEDVVVHVTTAPSEALMRKCAANLQAGLRPLIVTTYRSVPAAESLAEIQGIADRLDVLDAEQFIAANIYELSGFQAMRRKPTFDKLAETYNAIVDRCETDASLKIAVD